MREGFAEADHFGIVGANFDAERALSDGMEECGGDNVGCYAPSEALSDESCVCEDEGSEGTVGVI